MSHCNKTDNKPDKILWIALFKGIGDAVLFYPTLDRCRELFPDAGITVILRNDTVKKILELYEFGGKILVLPEEKKRIPAWIMKNGFKSYDVVFDASSIEQMHLSRWLTYAFSKRERVGYHLGSSSWLYNRRLDTRPIAVMHQKDMYANLLKPFSDETEVELLPAPTNETEQSRNPLKKGKTNIVIHPGARDSIEKFTKAWPPEYYRKLIIKLAEQPNSNIILIGSKSEAEQFKNIFSELKLEKVINRIGETTINKMFSLIKGADLFIGNNSGPLHIAASYNRKIVTFAGGIPLNRWGPATTETEPVILGLDKRCRNCNEYECIDHGKPCLEKITIEETWTAVKELLDS